MWLDVVLSEIIEAIFPRRPAMNTEPVLDWVAKQDVPPGKARELPLPPELADRSCEGKVHVARLGDGRLCVLLKTSIGWKDNFEGVFSCDGPLRPDEIARHADGQPPFICLAGYGIFQELYLRSARLERTMPVYFDLN
jgi:hypothetical protein